MSEFADSEYHVMFIVVGNIASIFLFELHPDEVLASYISMKSSYTEIMFENPGPNSI